MTTAMTRDGVRGTFLTIVGVALCVVLVALGVVLGVLETFLHPLRYVGAPVGVIGAGVVNLVVVQLVGRGTRSRAFGLLPGGIWLLTVIGLTVGRPEGDFVVPGTWTGYGYLLAGTAGVLLGAVLLPAYATQRQGADPPR